MNTLSKILVIGALAGAIGSAFAQNSNTPPTAPANAAVSTHIDPDFAQMHPRIAEVLGRLRMERERIAADLKSGKITEEQAEALLEKTRKIHRQELRDVRKNDGVLTKQEQEKLNREEDLLSMRIHHDVAKNAEQKEDRVEKAEKHEHGKSSKK